ncbi:MAG TPA: hypothetical protein VNK04_25840 [Gemmataceae bacterium]|jgi:hypothetical protein|nr:hypothetical protein [Gemmataceae bacterium]
MTGVRVVRRRHYILALLGILAAGLSAVALAANPNEREVKPGANVQDKDDIFSPDSKIWVLDFRFKDPRIITVNVPGRGRKICWYLWYQVINRTKEPRYFIPTFELVTLDKNTVHRDQVLPAVQEEIIRLEDPTGYQNIKNSVTIYKDPIPPSKPDAAPRPVTGVAIWDDVNPDTTRFNIYVTGLSNGWSLTDNPEKPDGEPIIRRKTLELCFRRPGDRYYQHSGEIQYMPPPNWIYRAVGVKAPAAVPDKKDEKGGEKVGAAPALRKSLRLPLLYDAAVR